MAVENNVLTNFIDSIQPQQAEKKANAHQAIVSHVDNEGVVWVYVTGSETATPTESTSAEVKRGDEVTVEWRNNKLYIAGNYSDPSAGTKRVASVERIANDAVDIAGAAVQTAESVNQYFWHKVSGTDAGAHITQIPKDQFEASPSGGNTLMRSDGVLIRDGLNTLADITKDSFDLYNLDDDDYRLKTFSISNKGGTTTATITDELYIFPDTSMENAAHRNLSQAVPIGTTFALYSYSSDTGVTFTKNGNVQLKNYSSGALNVTVRYDGNDVFAGYINNAALFERIAFVYSLTYVKPTYDLGIRAGVAGAFSSIIGENLYADGDNQTAIGKYNEQDSNNTYAFIVGNGTDDSNRSNAFAVDWNGYIEAPTETITPTITASAGTLVSCTAFKFGKMVFMTIAVRKTSSTASGANIFVGTISETAYRPKAIVTGASYYDAHAISGQINTSGAIVFRNASPTAVTIGSSYSVAVSFTYMID